jgi:hypothetical protein
MNKIFLGKSLPENNRLFYKSAEDLDNEAGALSNYNGGGGGYIGMNDDFLNFSGNVGSFAEPIDQGKLYTLILTNANASTRIALLCPGLLFETAVGLIADGAFNDTGGNAGLSGTGNPLPIALFNSFIRYFPTIVAGFKVSTSNISQFDMNLTVFKQSPFKSHESRIINVGSFASEANPNTTLISVEQSFYMDNQTIIQYPVLGLTTVTVGLFFGPSLNIAHALREKTERAKGNLVRMGLQPNLPSFRGRR